MGIATHATTQATTCPSDSAIAMPRGGRPAGESAIARHAYTIYESLGVMRRSYRVVAETLRAEEAQRYSAGTGTGLIRRIERWAARYKWQERAHAYDAARAATERKRLEHARTALAIRNAEEAAALRTLVEDRLIALLALDDGVTAAGFEAQRLISESLPIPPDIQAMLALSPLALTVDAATLVRLWSHLIEVERRARAEAICAQGTQLGNVEVAIFITSAATTHEATETIAHGRRH